MYKISVLLTVLWISVIHSGPFDRLIHKLPAGWSGKLEKNRLVIQKNTPVKIVYFNYGMEADPPVLDHRYEIIVECRNRLSEDQVKKRIRQGDDRLRRCQERLEQEPTKSNWVKCELLQESFKKDIKYMAPVFSDNGYSYFIYDNFPYGHIFVDEVDKLEIEELMRGVAMEGGD